MTPKQRAFVSEYVIDFNAPQAAIRAGYAKKYAHTNASKLLQYTTVGDEIERRLKERAMSADEVLERIANIARGTAADYLTVDEWGHTSLDLPRMKEEGKLHLIKKYKVTKQGGTEIELYDAQGALNQLGKAHGLFISKVEHSGNINVTDLTDRELDDIVAKG